MPPKFVPAPVPDFPKASGFAACDAACDSCDRSYDKALTKTIDMELPLYGGVAPLTVHICCCTGKMDWIHSIEDEEGSTASRISNQIKQYVDKMEGKDRIVLSNVSIDTLDKNLNYRGTEVMILSPAFCMLTNVPETQSAADMILRRYALGDYSDVVTPFDVHHMGFKAVVLICSHMRRDARCGKTAPILLEQFDEELRERDLFYDPDENDSEDGRVLVTCVSHIGGHKFAGNVLIYRRQSGGAFEGIWLGRVFPHHVGFIIDQTIVSGAVPYPLLRGGVRW